MRLLLLMGGGLLLGRAFVAGVGEGRLFGVEASESPMRTKYPFV